MPENESSLAAVLDTVLDTDTQAAVVEDLDRYVVVGVYQNKYGISTDSTIELIGSKAFQATRVPHSPDFVAGVINHRGSIIPVINTRTLLGFPKMDCEISGLFEMLDQREQDHVNWLNELKRCVTNDEEFKLGRDPNMCAFGKWYNELRSNSAKLEHITKGDAALQALIDQFDAPHKRIHGIANRTLEMAQGGEQSKALEVIQRAWRTDLASMRELFASVKSAIAETHVPMMIITEYGDRKAALLVDTVYTVKDVLPSAIEPLPESAENQQFLKGLVHEENGSYVLIGELAHIYDVACPVESDENA